MPLVKYDSLFGGKKGSAAKAKRSMENEYGPKKGEEVFYATMAKRKKGSTKKSLKSYMPKGMGMSPKGDIGEKRQEESSKVGGFKSGKVISAARALPYRECKKESGPK